MKRTKKETQRIIDRMNFVRELLAENGLILSGYDPGVLALQKTGLKDFDGIEQTVSLNFERTEWAWLEPILLELRKLRHESHSESK